MSTTADATRTLALDKAHSEFAFQVRHLMAKVRGRFADFEGTIHEDDVHPEQSSMSLVIRAGSVETNEPKRDQHLRSADFFDVERHPTITFTSTGIVRKGEREFDVTGDLNIRGVTRKVTVPVVHLGVAKDPWGNAKHGFEAETTLNRKEFGLVWNAALETGGFLVGDEVKVSVTIEAA